MTSGAGDDDGSRPAAPAGHDDDSCPAAPAGRAGRPARVGPGARLAAWRKRDPALARAASGVLLVLLTLCVFQFVPVSALIIILAVTGAAALTVRETPQWRRRRRTARPLPAAPPEVDWSDAAARFAVLRTEYAAYECDALAVLRLPALSDVGVPSTARFVDALAEAQALATDARPPESHAAAFVAAVEQAERAWHAARDAAERIRLSTLTPEERGTVERVIKLLTTARDSDNDAERRVAYARAREDLARLDRAGVVRLPRPAQAALEHAGRGQLPA